MFGASFCKKMPKDSAKFTVAHSKVKEILLSKHPFGKVNKPLPVARALSFLARGVINASFGADR